MGEGGEAAGLDSTEGEMILVRVACEFFISGGRERVELIEK